MQLSRSLVVILNIGFVALGILGGVLLFILLGGSETTNVASVGLSTTANVGSSDGLMLGGDRAVGSTALVSEPVAAIDAPVFDEAEFIPIPATPVPTATPTPLPTPSPTPEPTPDAAAQAAALAEREVVVFTPTPVAPELVEPTAEPTPTPEPTPTTEATAEPTPEPSATPTPTPSNEPTSGWTETDLAAGSFWVSAADGLTVRNGPGGDQIDNILHGTEVIATGRGGVTSRTWAEISSPVAGWVAAEFLVLSAPEPLNPGEPQISTTGPTSEQMAALRNCESGGNYGIDTGNGFYGAYQFSISTWDSVAAKYLPHLGGLLPSLAAPADQDAMMVALHSEQGFAPWPGCRAKLGLP